MDDWFAQAHSEGSMYTERPRLTDSGALLPEHCATRMPLGVPLHSLASVYSSINENHMSYPLTITAVWEDQLPQQMREQG